MSDTILVDLREDIAEFLRSDAYFSDIPVLTQKQHNTIAEINRRKALVTSQGGKIGAAVIVMDPVASDKYSEVPFGVNEILQAIRVLEHPELNAGANGTGKAALSIARRVERVLKHYQPVGYSTALTCGAPTIVPVDIEFVPLAYDVNFLCQEADTTIDTKVSIPVFSPSSGSPPQTVTISTATAGAAIYFTTNGTHPWSGNAAATLYSAPVSIAAPTTLRAAAFKTGSIPSNVNRADYA